MLLKLYRVELNGNLVKLIQWIFSVCVLLLKWEACFTVIRKYAK